MSFYDLFLAWARVGRAHNHKEMRELTKASQVATDVMRESAVLLIDEAAGRPLLVSYMADGTPIVTRHTVRQAMEGKKTVRRSGKGMEEFYCQAAFYAYVDAMGMRHARAVVPDPMPMSRGKTSAAQLSFALQCIVNPRSCGHAGILVFHCSFDRAPFQSLSRLLTQHFTMQAATIEIPGCSRGADLLYLLFWFLKTPCSYHDAHKSFEWSLHSQFKSVDLMSEVYVALTSCSNSYKQLTDMLQVWLGNVIRVVDPEEEQLPSEGDLHELWHAMGASAEIIEEIVALRMCFRDGRLLVTEEAPLDDILSRVVYVVTSLWRFRPFAASRWINVGTASRTFIGALLCGLADFVEVIVADPTQSKFTINGFRRLSMEGKVFVCVAGLSSFPTDTVLRGLMRDNRVLAVHADLKVQALGSVMYLTELSAATWSAIAPLCGISGEELRSKTLRAAHISMSFMEHRIWAELDRLPWRLMHGDLDANLDELMREDEEPAEPTSAKIYRLLHLGWNRSELKAALRLCREVPWGTKVVEEIHASGSCVRKFHPEIATEPLRIRAHVHALRRVLPTPSAEEKKEQRLLCRLANLEKRQPQKLGGRQALFQELMMIIAKWKQEGRKVDAETTRAVMKNKELLWSRMSAIDRRHLDDLAVANAGATAIRTEHEIECVRGEIAILIAKREDRERDPGPLALSSCRWTADDMAKLQEAFDCKVYSHAYVRECRERVAQAPPLLPRFALEQLAAIPVYKFDAPVERPEWLSSMAQNRDVFGGTAIEFETDVGRKAYAFMFAMQNPLHAQFSELVEVNACQSVVTVTPANWDQEWLETWNRRFVVTFSQSVPWHHLPRLPIANITVLRGLVFVSKCDVVTDDDGVSMAQFIEEMPRQVAVTGAVQIGGGANGAARPPSWLSDLLEKHPWLAGSFEEEAAAAACIKRDEKMAESPMAEPVGDEELELAWDELRMAREAMLLAEGAHHAADFTVKLLGGAWTRAHREVAFDAVRAAPRRFGPAEVFLTRFGITPSARFEISAYGIESAKVLANTWCTKMQHYFDIFEGSGDPDYRFTPNDHASYDEPAEFAHLLEVLAGFQRARCLWLRNLRPRD